MSLEYFPPSLLKPSAKADVIAWLKVLPIPAPDKKRTYTLWAETHDIKVTRADLLLIAPDLPQYEP